MSLSTDCNLREIPFVIAICAGEASGDILASGLMAEFKRTYPNTVFIGIAGPKMQAQGCKTIFDMESIAVMGVTDVLKRLPGLLKLRKKFLQHVLDIKPDLFIGIDAPDFNLPIECVLKSNNIKTMHYVGPSVWAWRKNRIKKIKRAVDKMLTILPFENSIYQKHHIPVEFVGHPKADEIVSASTEQAKSQLKLPLDKKIIVLMPGSRKMEIKLLGPKFLEAAEKCYQHNKKIIFLAALNKQADKNLLESFYQSGNYSFSIQYFVGQTRQVISAADVVLVTSGTATLEVMLLQKPMVVAYKFSCFNYLLAKLLVKIQFFSLPNLLANKQLVPELFQSEVNPNTICEQLFYWLDNKQARQKLLTQFARIRDNLQCNANLKAAKAVESMLMQ